MPVAQSLRLRANLIPPSLSSSLLPLSLPLSLPPFPLHPPRPSDACCHSARLDHEEWRKEKERNEREGRKRVEERKTRRQAHLQLQRLPTPPPHPLVLHPALWVERTLG